MEALINIFQKYDIYWKISMYLYTWHVFLSHGVPHHSKDNYSRQQFPSYVYISKFIWNGFSTAAAPHEIEDIKCLCEYLFRCWREFDAINQAITWSKIGLLCLSYSRQQHWTSDSEKRPIGNLFTTRETEAP